MFTSTICLNGHSENLQINYFRTLKWTLQRMRRILLCYLKFWWLWFLLFSKGYILHISLLFVEPCQFKIEQPNFQFENHCIEWLSWQNLECKICILLILSMKLVRNCKIPFNSQNKSKQESPKLDQKLIQLQQRPLHVQHRQLFVDWKSTIEGNSM